MGRRAVEKGDEMNPSSTKELALRVAIALSIGGLLVFLGKSTGGVLGASGISSSHPFVPPAGREQRSTPAPSPKSGRLPKQSEPVRRLEAGNPGSDKRPHEVSWQHAELAAAGRNELSGGIHQLYRRVMEDVRDDAITEKTARLLRSELQRVDARPASTHVHCSVSLCRLRISFDGLDELRKFGELEPPEARPSIVSSIERHEADVEPRLQVLA